MYLFLSSLCLLVVSLALFWVEIFKTSNVTVQLLFGFPLPNSAVPRLARFAASLGPGSLSVMVDHPTQLKSAATIARTRGSHRPLVFLKMDVGSGRAGVVPGTTACAQLIDAALDADRAGDCVLYGVYCHAGHSYSARRDWEAMHLLAAEFAGLRGVAALIHAKSPGHDLVLSVGATPTATTVQHPALRAMGAGAGTPHGDAPTSEVERLFSELKDAGFKLEVHAGV